MAAVNELVPLADASDSTQAVGDRAEGEVHGNQVLPAPPTEPHRLKAFKGMALLFVVALMWGGNSVCTRILFLSPQAPSSVVIGTVQTAVAALWCIFLLVVAQIWQKFRQSRTPCKEYA